LEEISTVHGGGFIGTKIIFGGEGGIVQQLFPAGGFIIVTYMIWTLVNFRVPRS
jgi:hypothetical protein